MRSRTLRPVTGPGPVRTRRHITGMSAVLLPYSDRGTIDWTAFEAHVARTRRRGHHPGREHGHRLRATARPTTNASTRSTSRRRSPTARSSPAPTCADGPGAPYDHDAYLRAAEAVVARGGTPVIFPSYGLNALDDDGWVAALAGIGATLDRFIGFELGAMFVPYGRIVSLDAYRGMMEIPSCIGAKHSSLSRALEWERLALRDAVRPDFAVFTGNDLAIDMVMYGSDYLLGLSTFAPDVFARARPRCGSEGDPAFYELQRRAAVPRAVRVPAAGARVPARRRDVPEPCGAGPRATSHRRGVPRRPDCRPRGARGDRGAADAVDVSTTAFTQVKQLRTRRRAPRAPRPAGRRRSRSTDDVDPAEVARRRRSRSTTAAPDRSHVPNRFAVLPMEGWDGSRDGRPTDLVRRRWQRFAASGCGLVWGEATAVRARRPRQPEPARASTTTTVADLAALRRAARTRRRSPGCSSPTPAGGPAPTARPRRAPRTPSAARRARRRRRAASVLTDDELDELVGDFVDAAALGARGRLRLRRRQALPRLPAARAAHRRTTGPGATAATSPAAPRFLRAVVAGIRARAPGLADRGAAVGVRSGAVRRRRATASASPDVRRPVPRTRSAATAPALGIDLTETHAFLDLAHRARHRAASARPRGARTTTRTSSDRRTSRRPTATSRPRIRSSASPASSRRRPRSPPRTRALTVVGAGYSYLQEWLPNVAAGRRRGRRRRDGRPRPHGALVPRARGRRARRATARRPPHLPDVQRLHDRAPRTGSSRAATRSTRSTRRARSEWS